MVFDREGISHLRRPEYTGANRCVPCTVLNVLIATLVSIAVGFVILPVGVSVFFLSIVIIYLRGYLVPGTPALTKRFLPEPILAVFDKQERGHDTQTWNAIERHKRRKENQVDAEQFLQSVDAITETQTGEYSLSESFRALTQSKLDTLTTAVWANDGGPDCDLDTVVDLLDADTDSIRCKDETYPSFQIGPRIRQWPSEPALRTDIATHRALIATSEDWKTLSLEQRLQILTALRSFVKRCPCGGELQESVEAVPSCCRSGEVLARRCSDCGKPLMERDVSSNDWFSVEDI